MIFVTGDTHGGIDIAKLNSRSFSVGKTLTKQDYVIICGDFGFLWDAGPSDRYWIKWFDAKPFTTLFIDGNHENFDLLLAYPVQPWNGGKARIITESVLHLTRGQVFSLDGTSIFTFGGAHSWDIEGREEGVSWWKQEIPTEAELEEGIKNLAEHDWTVDFILTHTCPTEILPLIHNLTAPKTSSSSLNLYFSELASKATFSHWFFGHFHMDQRLTDKFTLLFNNVLELPSAHRT